VLRIVLGLALLGPAGLFWIGGLVVPTVKTLVTSMQEVSPIAAARFVGLANYAYLFQDLQFSSALRFTLLMVAVRVLVVAILPPLLAFAVNEFGRAVRIPVRLLFTVPLALFAPVVTALTWALALNPRAGLVNIVLEGLNRAPQPWLGDPERARSAFLLIDGLTTFGLACGVGLVFYLAALRGSGEKALSWKAVRVPLVMTWGIGLLATIALTLQSFTMSHALTQGGPGNATMTLALHQFNAAFRYFRFGVAAAGATLVLAVVALLGLAAGLIVVLGRLRLETVSWGKRSGLLSGKGRPSWGRPVAIALLALTLLVSLGGCGLSALPRPWNALNSLKTEVEMLGSPPSLLPSSPSLDAYAALGQEIPVGRVLINTVVPALSVLLLQVPIVYLGALGIGAVRPFKRWSELLLLPFSPWLFVTVGLLSVAAFEARRSAGLLNTMAGLASPIILSVPALFILTLFFKGQEPKWRAARAKGQAPAGAFFTRLILPSLPLALLLACASLLVAMQGLLWPLLITSSRENFTAPLALLFFRMQMGSSWPVLAAGLTLFGLPAFAFFFVAFGLLQSLYADRLALAREPSGAREPSFDAEGREAISETLDAPEPDPEQNV
jgi:ABC-type sugar transport system permease subunit